MFITKHFPATFLIPTIFFSLVLAGCGEETKTISKDQMIKPTPPTTSAPVTAPPAPPTAPATTTPPTAPPATSSPAANNTRPPAPKFAQQMNCLSCHARDTKIVGPSWISIAEKYKNDKTAVAKLSNKVLTGGSGSFGPVAMPPQSHLQPDDAKYLVQWILSQTPQ